MQNRLLGVLGGRDLGAREFKLWAENAHKSIAADSGASHFFEVGLRPTAIVGDFDSLDTDIDLSGIDLYRFEDQNSSDCDKLLDLAEGWGYDSIVLAGVEGDRLDHLLASLGSCLRSSLRVRLALRDGIADLLRPGDYRVRARAGERVSVLPVLPSLGVTLEGVEWPLEGVELQLGGQVSLSNIALGAEIRVSFETGALLVCQPRSLEELPDWDMMAS